MPALDAASEHLELTIADIQADVFTTGKELAVEGEPRAVLASLPGISQPCGHEDLCYLVDLYAGDDLLDTREVERKIAYALAGWSE